MNRQRALHQLLAVQGTGNALLVQSTVKEGELPPEETERVTHERKRLHSELPQMRRGKPNKTESGYVMLCKTPEELEEIISNHAGEKYRAKQILSSLLHGCKSIEEINQIPKSLREKLIEGGMITGRSHVHSVAKASDGTKKILLQLFDGRMVETVGIPASRSEKERLTACISSQVPLLPGLGGFSRNLAPHEIVDQVLAIQEEMQERVSHVVFMGMGEPLLNLNSVVEAYAWINEHIGIGSRNFTISTVGVLQGIRRLADAKLQLTLAVSLHASNQELRERLIPSANKYPLLKLMRDCRAYFAITRRRITFEYILISGVNDSNAHARELAQLLEENKLKTHVNLMLWNKVPGIDYERPKWSRACEFEKILQKCDISTTIRKSRGLGAAAACGQLQNVHQKQPLSDFVTLT